MSDSGLLKGYRVLDLSQYIPGPLATRLLADLGADVLKVEPPAGDPMRGFDQPDSSRTSPLYTHLNRGKRVIRLNLKSPHGKVTLERLIKGADVLLESFRPGVMERLGFGRELLKRINPELIHCALSGFGQNGPYRERAGHDLTYCALGGALSASGTARRPVMTYPPLADHAGALFSVNSILAALLGRHRSNRGSHLDISICDAVMSLQYPGLLAAWEQHEPSREGVLLNGGAACYNIYRTSDDRFLALAALEEKFWHRFCDALSKPEWRNRQWEPLPQTRLITELREMFTAASLAHWMQSLGSCDCCLEPIPPLGELAAHPQHRSRGLLREGEVAYPAWFDGQPLGLGESPVELQGDAKVNWLDDP